MSTYFAQVTDGVVTNVAVVSAEFMAANPDRYQGEWIETFVGVGSGGATKSVPFHVKPIPA